MISCEDPSFVISLEEPTAAFFQSKHRSPPHSSRDSP